jgi:homoserine dehydrogenase
MVSARDRTQEARRRCIANHLGRRSVALAKSDADVVVELIGGEDGPARALVEAALEAGKHVVTANKALLAYHGAELAALAEERGVALKFEAAAAGGIPIVQGAARKPDRLRHRRGARHPQRHLQFHSHADGSDGPALRRRARRGAALGYAEADPTLDIGGGDTAHKLALLASLAFGIKPDLSNMTIQGIAHITPEDIAFRARVRLPDQAARRHRA